MTYKIKGFERDIFFDAPNDKYAYAAAVYIIGRNAGIKTINLDTGTDLETDFRNYDRKFDDYGRPIPLSGEDLEKRWFHRQAEIVNGKLGIKSLLSFIKKRRYVFIPIFKSFRNTEQEDSSYNFEQTVKAYLSHYQNAQFIQGSLKVAAARRLALYLHVVFYENVESLA